MAQMPQMTPDEINRVADALREWFHDESDVKSSFDAIRVLALVLGDFAADVSDAFERMKIEADS